jgi:hypothetical protein
MKKLKILIKSFIPVLIITLSPLLLEATCCTWMAYGCVNQVSIHDSGYGFLTTDCGDGIDYVGYGQYGGCSGVVHACDEPVYFAES